MPKSQIVDLRLRLEGPAASLKPGDVTAEIRAIIERLLLRSLTSNFTVTMAEDGTLHSPSGNYGHVETES